jgi:hypothetical protein
MKKIKITKEQYNRITNLLKEGFPVIKKNLVDKTFQQALAGKEIKNLGEETNFNIKKSVTVKGLSKSVMKESVGDLKQETLELIKYLYRKTEDFSPFWAENDLTYDDICDALESKGIIIKQDGKYTLSKSLGSAEEAKQAVEAELSQMIGGEKEEIEEGDWFDSHPDHPANQSDPRYTKASVNSNELAFEGVHLNQEFAILKDKAGDLYALYYGNIPEEELNTISDELGYTEEEVVGRDEDGMPDVEYYYNWENDDDEKLSILAAYADTVDKAGEGLEDWESGNFDLVKLDDELKAELSGLYDKDETITEILSGINEDEESSEDRTARIKASLALVRQKSKDWDTERFAQRDRQNAIDSKKAEDKAKDALRLRHDPVPTPEPKKPVGQYRLFDKGIDEMSSTASVGGGFTTAVDFGGEGIVKREMPNIPVVREGMTATPSTTGEYPAPAFKMKKNHTDFAESKPEAFKKAQIKGGGIVKFNDCVKLNNKPAGSGCSTGAVDKVVTVVKTKGNVSAPSLSENKIYETIAKQTGKTIAEVKKIIQSKNKKS